MLLKSILAAVIVVSVIGATPSLADNGNNRPPKQYKNKQYNKHNYNKHKKYYRERGGTWNYNYNYKYENNTKFYNDPYFWGSAFGLLDDIITAPRGEVYVQPGPVYAQPPVVYEQPSECFMAWTQVYVPGKGYVPYQTTVCP